MQIFTDLGHVGKDEDWHYGGYFMSPVFGIAVLI